MLAGMRAVTVLLLLALPAAAQDATPEARDKAIVAAIKHLDGAIWKLQQGGSPRREYTLAIAGWAYLLAADKPKLGKRLPGRRKQIDRIHKELVRYVERVEKLYEKSDKGRAPPAGFAAMRTAQYTWPLSVAAHYFAESAARGKRKGECKRMLKTIAKILTAAQQENGGWGHDDASRPGMGLPPIQIPKPGGGKITYPATLLCASHCALAAVGTAHRVAKAKSTDTRKKGRAYFEKAQNADGTFPYDPSQKLAHPSVHPISLARTSGAVYAMFLAGAPKDDPVAKKALAAIDKHPEMMSEGHGSATMALQYGALLADARGDAAWRVFRRIFFPRILAKQDENGVFECVAIAKAPGVTVDGRPFPGMPDNSPWANQGKTYVTAIHTLILLLDRTDSRIAPDAPGVQAAKTKSE